MHAASRVHHKASVGSSALEPASWHGIGRECFQWVCEPTIDHRSYFLDRGIASIEPVFLSTQITPTSSLSLHPFSSDSEQESGEESGLGSDEGEESDDLV